MKKTKVCGKCGRELPLDMFNSCKSSSDGLQNQCRDCKHIEFQKKKWHQHNLALERWPWPFND